MGISAEDGAKVREVYARLAAPFDRVKTRKAGGGRELSYITERMAMNRLDETVGPENWGYTLEIVHVQTLDIDGVICRLWVRIPGTDITIPREGFGGFRRMEEQKGVFDPENTFKTGKSDAFKVAASAHGVARYLYKDGSADFSGDEGGDEAPETLDAAVTSRRAPGPAPSADVRTGGPDGAAVVDWLKRTKDQTGIDMLPFAKGLAAEKGWPDRPSLWNSEQADAARKPLKARLGELLAGREKAAVPGAAADAAAEEDGSPFDEAPAAPATPTGATTFTEVHEARKLLAEVTELLYGVPRKKAKSGPRKGQMIEDDDAFRENYKNAHRILREHLPEAVRGYGMIETAPLETLHVILATLAEMKAALAEDERAFDTFKRAVA